MIRLRYLFGRAAGWLVEVWCPVDQQGRVLQIFARRAYAHGIALPEEIHPDPVCWSVRVANMVELLRWWKALSLALGDCAIVQKPWGTDGWRWTVAGKVAGQPVRLWCPCDPPRVGVLDPVYPLPPYGPPL